MTEFELIGRLVPNLPTNPTIITGPGDDCAVIDVGLPADYLLFKVDAVAESVHFTRSDPPEKIGRKALARALSDIAAMGGWPVAALVSLGLPAGFEPAWVEALYRGLNGLAAEHQVAIAGGETIRQPGGASLSVSLLGRVEKERCILRAGAKPGDALFVTGELGGSQGGKHLDFEPRIAQARWLTAHFKIHAMIDLSDGLAGDLRHLLHASGLGAELLVSAIPISREARTAARAAAGRSSAKPPLLAALTDGEDFELLFTVASGDAVKLLDGWKIQFPGLPLSCIGRTRSQPGIDLRDLNGSRPLNVTGYAHFQEQ